MRRVSPDEPRRRHTLQPTISKPFTKVSNSLSHASHTDR